MNTVLEKVVVLFVHKSCLPGEVLPLWLVHEGLELRLDMRLSGLAARRVFDERREYSKSSCMAWGLTRSLEECIFPVTPASIDTDGEEFLKRYAAVGMLAIIFCTTLFSLENDK